VPPHKTIDSLDTGKAVVGEGGDLAERLWTRKVTAMGTDGFLDVADYSIPYRNEMFSLCPRPSYTHTKV